MVDWSEDRIAALSKQDLKNLLANAERKSAAEIIARCKAEMDKRDTSKPRKTSKPRTELKEFEHAMSEQLAEIGKAMAAQKQSADSGVALTEMASAAAACEAALAKIAA